MNKNLYELKEKYKNGELSKDEYIEKMHEIHEILFEYSEFISDSDIAKIKICDDSVIMTSRDSGLRVICDKTDRRAIPLEILNFDYYEKDDFKMVQSLINENDCVLDVGANIGWYSMNIAKAVKGVKVYSFEPIPKTYEYLKKNIELNSLSNVTAFNFGFSNEEKSADFYYYPEGPGNSSFANLSGCETVEKINCRIRRMDDFIKERGIKVDFIKCDVEGAELFVLEGGMETIKMQKPIIFTEMLRKWARKFNYHPNDIINLLSEQGYGCYVSKNEKLTEFYKMDDSTTETNFFFLHKEKHAALL